MNKQSPLNFLQPHPLTSVMQLSITAASVCVAASAIVFAVKSMSDERNARLVEIGVGVLRVDPEKETQVSAARQWALDLIDANSGVKFSREAREELLRTQFRFSGGSFSTDFGSSFDSGARIPAQR